jgi:hypothetical protein
LVAAETAAVAAAIIAARVRWQAGAAAWWKPEAMVQDDRERDDQERRLVC